MDGGAHPCAIHCWRNAADVWCFPLAVTHKLQSPSELCSTSTLGCGGTEQQTNLTADKVSAQGEPCRIHTFREK